MKELAHEVVESVKKKVVKEFPELAGVEPSCSLKRAETELARRLDMSLPKKMDLPSGTWQGSLGGRRLPLIKVPFLLPVSVMRTVSPL